MPDFALEDDPVFFDVETYPNFWLGLFRRFKSKKTLAFEMAQGENIDRDHLEEVLTCAQLIGFNSQVFDIPQVCGAISGMNPVELNEMAEAQIKGRLMWWEAAKEFGFDIPRDLDHIDLFNVAPGVQTSLKLYNGRLHGRRMQDLPIEPGKVLTEREMDEVHDYCHNDLAATRLLWKNLRSQLELRVSLSVEHGIDLRSKSDAQVAEAVIKSELTKRTGKAPEKATMGRGSSFYYEIPDFLHPDNFDSDQVAHILNKLDNTPFIVEKGGKVAMPDFLTKTPIVIGNGHYRMGIGGLHSSEKRLAIQCDDSFRLIDHDVTSYYPAIILNLGLYPIHLGKEFLNVYRDIVERRIAAKKAGDKTTADSLKISVNGSFGKLGSIYSVLFSPDLMIQTTLTGQLSLLLLIDWLDSDGFEVVSANTGGLVTKVPKERQDAFDAVIRMWERHTGFVTEDTIYVALYARDVNNYVAVKQDGSTKTKGAFAPTGMMKNPAGAIVVEAALNRITKGIPVERTIAECDDLRKFVVVRTVDGGAMKDGEFLGKAVRWYYSTATRTPITYRGIGKGENRTKVGDKVPDTEGAMPIMDWPKDWPDDLDEDWYAAEARNLLITLGYKRDLIGGPKGR